MKFCIHFLLICLPLSLSAQDGKEQDALVVKRTANFDISGKGDAVEWNSADWIQLQKRKGTAIYTTRAKLLYSDTGIYGLFSCQDHKITATFKEDFADLWTEDVVEIFLWPDESMPVYFEYELSPLNYELPILVPNMDGDFLGWKPWHYEGERKTRHATHINRDANGKAAEWMAEFFIPYALLKPLKNVPPKKGSIWRVNMYRVDYDQQYSSWAWKPVQTNFHDYERFGLVRFD
ncbi:MAG: carbohydrate-binding family 9-like protein [Cyclobacteriaceae bacterium]